MATRRTSQVVVLSAVLMLGGTVGSAAAAETPVNELYSPVTAADIANPAAADAGLTIGSDDITAESAKSAIRWFKKRDGSSAYEGYCERAVRLAWDRATHHASAIDHWNSSDGKRHKSGTPPKGAFVFWNISEYGHVGISDGEGGFWATSVDGAIGHANSLDYFSNYLGWKRGNDN